jgi:large subunit ribosomal protein L24
MAKFKIKRGDLVMITTGNSKIKGKTGEVLEILTEKNRAIVAGLNIVKRHTKPSANNPQGAIIEKEAPVHISNLALIDPKTGTPTRVAIKEVDGKKVRVAKKSGETI